MLLSVTGTPGTGKTTLCETLALEGYDVVRLKNVILENSLHYGYDEAAGSLEIDVDIVLDHFHRNPVEKDMEKWTIIESHLSHHLEVDGIVLLRCDPRELEKRLARRDYSPDKIRENAESELVDVIAVEVKERNLPSVEIDTTGFEKEKIVSIVKNFIKGFPAISGYNRPCSLNWIGEMYED
ncbi:MAG: AAA family ATPase [Candidatus Thermoplasmatota archaeon]|nr:AAA family ATPase [Candidatus Thermoplasmatota archaeon]